MRHPTGSRGSRGSRESLGFPSLRLLLAAALTLGVATSLGMTCNGGHEPAGEQTFTSPQVNPIALSADGSRLYTADTTSGMVTVVDTASFLVVGLIDVGVDPVGLALRPGASELWVSNHVSDSVSVIDVDPASETLHQVVQTVQDIDANGVTQFDEPTGIAFSGDGSRAYVALSSRNDVAIVDATASPPQVTGRIHITAQEPRALAVQGDRLYVLPFESFNQTELSVCPDDADFDAQGAPQCTMDVSDLLDFVIQSPNVPGADARIVADPDVPDRDLYVIDIDPVSPTFHQVIQTVDSIGTLLYGMAVSSGHDVYVAQTDARNDANPNLGDNLEDLDNRMFLNQVARVGCAGGCGAPTIFELEPLPPAQPAAGDELARPYAIQVSGDGTTVLATAAGTSRVFSLDTATGNVLDILDLNAGMAGDFGQQIPRGLALHSDAQGVPQTAYVLNTLENTVSKVSVAPGGVLTHLAKLAVGNDPTPDAVRRGRIAFNNAFASTSGTFSCAGCHPDGNTDQLLWRIGGPCFFGACTGDDEIRSTMPVRGLKNTLPLHWDGTLGDPFGGSNGAVGNGGNGGSDCSLGGADGDHDCFRALVDASLQGVMCTQNPGGGCSVDGPAGLGQLTDAERDDMAVFLASVSYPPARERRLDDAVSASALSGFSDFFVDQGGLCPPCDLGDLAGVTTCADMDSGCHALPLGADTNSISLAGFDAPTMRGMTDRVLQFSLGVTNAEEAQVFFSVARTLDIGIGVLIPSPASPFPWDPVEGYEERITLSTGFAVFTPVYGALPGPTFQMFEEASVGHSGAFGRQLTLNTNTTNGPALASTQALLDALELADRRELVNLQGFGVRRRGDGSLGSVRFSYRQASDDYRDGSLVLDQAALLAEAAAGDLVLTLTARARSGVSSDALQPLLTVRSIFDDFRGTNPDIPFLPGEHPMQIAGTDVFQGARVVVDGVPDESGSVACQGGFSGSTGRCDSGLLTVTLSSPGGLANGLHLLQVQNPDGLVSPEFPFCVGNLAACQL